MKPNKPGEWHSRDGRRIIVFWGYNREKMLWRDPERCGGSHDMEDITGNDWLPAEPPKFPELPPPKPKLVYADPIRTCLYDGPRWWAATAGAHMREVPGGRLVAMSCLTVIPHPDNDPEAVRVIEEAKKA